MVVAEVVDGCSSFKLPLSAVVGELRGVTAVRCVSDTDKHSITQPVPPLTYVATCICTAPGPRRGGYPRALRLSPRRLL